MDRVFAGLQAPPPALPAATEPAPIQGQGRRRLLLAGAGLGLLLGSLVHLWQTQQRVQQDLQQERQWRMLERLRAHTAAIEAEGPDWWRTQPENGSPKRQADGSRKPPRDRPRRERPGGRQPPGGGG